MPPTDDYIGKTVASKYRVEQMIGEGGMGKVYKATQIALDKQVVLKVLRQALLSDERTVARFEREAKAASRLNHPNSISVLDFGRSDDGAMYIAMEYVQGKDLHQILTRDWPLPENRVIRVMSQVLSALADAHSAGVIHRDLKPENIMVEQRRGEADFVKVLDFGIAKIVDGSTDDGPALTRAGFVCGTPEYMSPEQARGAQLDHRSDLYAVGVIIYQLCAGLLPFDSDSAVGFATKHLTEIPPAPSKRRPDAKISPAMERLIMKALAKNPDDRPQTAEQFRAELMAIEKERRAGAPLRRGQTSASALAPVARKVTPIDQQETRVSGEARGPWSAREDTVPSSNNLGPVPEPVTTVPTTAPDRVTGDKWGLVFKVAVGLLVLIALALGGLYATKYFEPKKDTYTPPKNAPLPGTGNPWDDDVSDDKRRPADRMRKEAEGDRYYLARNLSLARTSYLEAWQADPQPAVAMKLGQVAFDLDELDEARGWWGRVKRDARDSKFISHIDQVLPR
ncbi:MAG: hypothetical protein AMXMBFR34_36190 [Myxococcaceae bacterium]